MLTAGDTLAARFLLRAKLGVGGFGQVWVARDNRDDREVAVKVMHEVHRVNARVLSRFVQEAEILQRLDHPSIPRAFACGTTKEEPFIAMELVSGESLHVLLDRRSNGGEPMGGKMIRALFGAVVSAVDYANAAGVVHRDLKPDNVIISKLDETRAEVKVLDFGIAKILGEASSEATTHGRLVGSLLHLAPEQIESEAIDARTDVFALGTLLFELLTLRQPWILDARERPAMMNDRRALELPANDQVSILQRIARDERPRASQHRFGVSRALEDAVMKALALEPQDRFATAADLMRAVEPELAMLMGVSVTDAYAPTAIQETALKSKPLPTNPVPVAIPVAVPSVPGAGAVQGIPARVPWLLIALAVCATAAAAATLIVIFANRDPNIVEESIEAVAVQPPAKHTPVAVAREAAEATHHSTEPAQPAARPHKKEDAPKMLAQPEHPPSPLARMRDRLRADPRNAVLINEASELLVTHARVLRDRVLGASIERRARAAALAFDADALERCARELEAVEP